MKTKLLNSNRLHSAAVLMKAQNMRQNRTIVMKIKNFAVIASILSLAAAANAQTDISSSFVNLNFDLNTQDAYATGFDMAAYNTPGWQDLTVCTDSGVQGGSAWWAPYSGYAAFVKSGEGAYDLSSYTIQAGDVFDVGLMAKSWRWSSAGATLTISLFYGSNPQNTIGSFTTSALAQGDGTAANEMTKWAHYEDAAIPASLASVGQTLGISVLSSGPSGSYGNFDSLTVAVVPEPGTMALAGLGGLALLFMSKRKA